MNDTFSYYTLGHFADVVPLFTVFKVDACFYCLVHTHTRGIEMFLTCRNLYANEKQARVHPHHR